MFDNRIIIKSLRNYCCVLTQMKVKKISGENIDSSMQYIYQYLDMIKSKMTHIFSLGRYNNTEQTLLLTAVRPTLMLHMFDFMQTQ